MPPELVQAVMVLVRYALASLFASLVTRGWIGADDLAPIVDATTTLLVGLGGLALTVAWGLYRSRFAAKAADVAKVAATKPTPGG